jgi:hypothetical protein
LTDLRHAIRTPANDHRSRRRSEQKYIVPLPQNSKGYTLGASELHFVKHGVFLALSRDRNGHGGSPDLSSYMYVTKLMGTLQSLLSLTFVCRQADLVDIRGATDIHGTKFDNPANQISVNGVLNSRYHPRELCFFRQLYQRYSIGEIWDSKHEYSSLIKSWYSEDEPALLRRFYSANDDLGHRDNISSNVDCDWEHRRGPGMNGRRSVEIIAGYCENVVYSNPNLASS